MNVRALVSRCWYHDEAHCPLCEPSWLEELEARDWLWEKADRDFRDVSSRQVGPNAPSAERVKRSLLGAPSGLLAADVIDDTTDEGWV